ncbi:MAG: hypothetical protein E6Q93_13000 [Burkholderiaceae bacterium]|nr:MAG: hypothetical protein E6Q93_13000 [Burkholderiaceae bacterium]
MAREALGYTFARWSGSGYPTHARGEAIPLAMRLVHLSHDLEAIARRWCTTSASPVCRTRSGTSRAR